MIHCVCVCVCGGGCGCGCACACGWVGVRVGGWVCVWVGVRVGGWVCVCNAQVHACKKLGVRLQMFKSPPSNPLVQQYVFQRLVYM